MVIAVSAPTEGLFRCWKFRSMVTNADQVLDQLLAQDNKARQEWERDFKLRSDPASPPLVGSFGPTAWTNYRSCSML